MKINNFSSIKDAFGPTCNDTHRAIPGTPLPSLVQDTPEEEFTELDAPSPEKDAVNFKSSLLIPVNTSFFQILDPESLYFRDGRRKIDMVLVYEEEELGVMTEAEARRRDNRRVFQVGVAPKVLNKPNCCRLKENLIKEGLELELEHKDLSFDCKTWFLKVHLPWKTKTRYAAVMGLKLPIKRFITISVKAWVSGE